MQVTAVRQRFSGLARCAFGGQTKKLALVDGLRKITCRNQRIVQGMHTEDKRILQGVNKGGVSCISAKLNDADLWFLVCNRINHWR